MEFSIKTFLTSLFLFLSLLLPQSASASGTVEQQLAFARWLMAEGEYYRAITEYRRVIFYAGPDDVDARMEAVLGVGQALAAGREYERSAEWVFSHHEELRKQGQGEQASLLLARGYLNANNGDRLLQVIKAGSFADAEAQYYEGLAFARKAEWGRAGESLGEVDPSSPFALRASNNIQVVLDAGEASWKNPTMAGWLSVLPGAGYVYAGHTQTGIASFIVNAVFFGATYQAFRSDQNVLGAFLAVLSASWYASNIYGSVRAAKRHNKHVQEQLWSRIEI